MSRQVETKSIPIKKVFLNDSSELPSHYSSTPGGTLYSTTPGGNYNSLQFLSLETPNMEFSVKNNFTKLMILLYEGKKVSLKFYSLTD